MNKPADNLYTLLLSGEPSPWLNLVQDYFSQMETERSELYVALDDLVNDSQHADHDCSDILWCPVMRARKTLAKFGDAK